MVAWRQYQEHTAALFRELGCEAETDKEVQGVRGRHLVDVSVRFSRFGLHQHWIVECKYWKSAVPKEKVLALKSIVEDTGADRGILVSESGHQAGAIDAARLTNITLISLEDLRSAARADLLSLGLSQVHKRAAQMKGYVFSLWETTKHSAGYFESRIRAEVDGALALRIGGAVSILGMGVEQAMLGRFPAPLPVLNDSDRIVRANSLNEFVAAASELLDRLDVQIAELKQGQASP
ncbi:restriction endonuclease [Bradyrhizobium sp. SZCCHNS3052]|uniref:restriction endonuclease n=1 Tax=Bradyrhizobium sp. SZCCHNS3052 TaxID=3057321 RepID=UPI002916C3B7|nr:restriction endonuclease [Bradyrhizobium sp. SZCCHNS3052]